jgi:hypothetical protein
MATERDRMNVSDFEAEMFDLTGGIEFNKILIYGDPGVGKTRLTGTLPGRKLWLAGEPGFVSAAQTGGGRVRIIPDTATALAAMEWLEDGNDRKFDWVVIDGASTMQNKFLLGYAAEAFDKNPEKRAHRNLPDRPDYLNAQNFMKGWLARAVDLKVNVFVTAHVLRSETDEGDLLVMPDFQGRGHQVASYISGQFYVVGLYRMATLKTGENKGKQIRRINWQMFKDPENDATYFAKDQSDRLGRFTDNPEMPDILEKINGYEGPIDTGSEEVSSAPPAKKAAPRPRRKQQ